MKAEAVFSRTTANPKIQMIELRECKGGERILKNESLEEKIDSDNAGRAKSTSSPHEQTLALTTS